jgi:hypothetical protein
MDGDMIGELLERIYERVHGKGPDLHTSAGIRHVIQKNGFGQRCPQWLLALLVAIANNGDFTTYHISREEEALERRSFNVDDFFEGLAEVMGFHFSHEGEYLWLSLDPLGISILLNYEVPGGGCEVKMVRKSLS